jgi:hypothetical protein
MDILMPFMDKDLKLMFMVATNIQATKVGKSFSPYCVPSSTRTLMLGANKIHLFNSNTMEDFSRHLSKLVPVKKQAGMRNSLSTTSTEKFPKEASLDLKLLMMTP